MSTHIDRLSNGLTIATHQMPGKETVALGIWIKAGSRDETLDQHGIAHFLEHMVFKGTKNRSAMCIATDIENVGGDLNAATNVEHTAYYARVLSEDLFLAVDVLCDLISNPLFNEDELEQEKQVILQEINAAHDTPDDVIFDHFTETAFRHQMIGRSILGTPSSIKSFSAADLRHFMQMHYTADRMVVVASGAIDHDSFVAEIEKRLGLYPIGLFTPLPELPNYIGGDFREYRPLMDTQLLLGFEGRAYHMNDFYSSQLLSILLGGGMSSRLFQEIREKRGLCYSIYAFHWGFSDTGIFGIHAATNEERVEELVPVILNELARVGDNIEPKELERIRAQYRANLIMAQESPLSQAHHMAKQILLYGHLISNEELMERLTMITTKRLSNLAQTMFFNTPPTLAAIGPVSRLMPFENIRLQLAHRQNPINPIS